MSKRQLKNSVSIIGLVVFVVMGTALWPRLGANLTGTTFFSSIISPLPTPTATPRPTTTTTPDVWIQQCPEMKWVEIAPGFWVIFYWNGQEWVEADPVADAWIFEDCDLPPRPTPAPTPTKSIRMRGHTPTTQPAELPASQAPTATPTAEPTPASLPVTGAG